MTRVRALVGGALVALLSGACAADGGATATPSPPAASLSLADASVDDGGTVDGNVVWMRLAVEGVELVKADGDTSGDTGHLHVFVDQDPVAPGQGIPRGEDIVHTVGPEVALFGLSEGEHRAVVVLGDGTHRRLGDAQTELSFTVAGPTVQVDAPTEANAGEPVILEVTVRGVELVKADGDTSGDSGHLHVFVDRLPEEIGLGNPIPQEEGIIHTTDTTIEIPDLEPGEHTLTVVLGDGTHTTSWPAPVADQVTVTVTG